MYSASPSATMLSAFASVLYKELYSFIKDEYATQVVYPPSDEIFSAFHFTPLSKVKVLVLGQDPYHDVNQAHGLSFSVQIGQDAPPSLQNIYKELKEELNKYVKEPLIEFRQNYTSPGLLTNANMIRVGDCPIEYKSNYNEIAYLRLTTNAAVHSDMVIFNSIEPIEQI